MAINVVVHSPKEEKRTMKITVKGLLPIDYDFELNVREALNGDFLIFDHNDIDIVVLKQQRKIVAFAKDLMTEVVYGAQARLFDHLRKKGIITYDSVQGGNIYGSMEATIINSKEFDIYEASVIMVAEWIGVEKPMMDDARKYDDMLEDHFANPEDSETTELGEVPHEQEKGSMNQMGMFAPYIYGRYTY